MSQHSGFVLRAQRLDSFWKLEAFPIDCLSSLSFSVSCWSLSRFWFLANLLLPGLLPCVLRACLHRCCRRACCRRCRRRVYIFWFSSQGRIFFATRLSHNVSDQVQCPATVLAHHPRYPSRQLGVDHPLCPHALAPGLWTPRWCHPRILVPQLQCLYR